MSIDHARIQDQPPALNIPGSALIIAGGASILAWLLLAALAYGVVSLS